MTHITQASVDGAASFTEVWAQFERWLGHHQGQLQAWVSWGDYDRQQLQQEWKQHQLTSLLQAYPTSTSNSALPRPANCSARWG